MIKEEEVYKIGVLNKPHGVRGEISFTFTDDVWDRVESDYFVLRVDGILVPFYLEEYRFRSEHSALLKFERYDTIDTVQELSGVEVFFPYTLTPEEDPDEYTWHYFTGFSVINAEKGTELGTIDEVDDSTQNVLFRVGDYLIPAVEEFIQDIDHQGRVITMQLPEGLLDLDA